MTKELGRFVDYTKNGNSFTLYTGEHTETFNPSVIAFIKDDILFIQKERNGIWRDVIISTNFTIEII